MKTELRQVEDQAYFVLADLDPAFYDIARHLAYGEVPGGWGLAVPADTPDLQRMYENWAGVVATLILQRAGLRPAPWAESLRAFMDRVEGEDVDWWLTGSGALAVRGLAVEPGDLDIVVNDEQGTHQLASLLRDHLIEPVRSTKGWVTDWFGRAFLGAAIDWIGVPNDDYGVGDFGPTAARQLETVSWQGREIRVPPLRMQLEVNKRRGRTERAKEIERWMAHESEGATP